MERKNTYIFGIVIIGIIILFFLMLNKKIFIAQENQAQEVAFQPQSLLSSGQSVSLISDSEKRPGITIIKKPASETKSILADEQAGQKSRSRHMAETAVSGQASDSGAKNNAEKTTASPAGIVKINKFPSKEETKEMNSRGIIMY